MNLFLLDNYDSFTFNIYQALLVDDVKVEVHRNDAISVEQVIEMRPDAVVLSPGPGRPEDAGILPTLLHALPADLPLLGVCLGHQAIVQHFGGSLEFDPIPKHGKATPVHFDESCPLFDHLPNPFEAGRYHSLRAVRETLPTDLRMTAWSEDGLVMAVQHIARPWSGVQFHPESILTPQGTLLMNRFLSLAGAPTR